VKYGAEEPKGSRLNELKREAEAYAEEVYGYIRARRTAT
jgi:hypothetical protein